MPCYQSTSLPSGVTTTGRTSYKTEAECLQACKEGACCEGTTCSVKPQCQCQGTGKTFKGVGTTCDSLKGACCEGATCTVKPQCQCQGTGKTFKGVGTTCSPNPCCSRCGDCTSPSCMPTYIVVTYSASFPRYVAGGLLWPGRSFSGGVTLTLTGQGDQAQCGQYTVLLAGEAAQALDASRVSVILRPREKVIAFTFYRKTTGEAAGLDPCLSRPTPITVISGTSTEAVNLLGSGWVAWDGVAVFGNGYGSKNNFCFASGSTTESSTNHVMCDPSGSINVTILDAY